MENPWTRWHALVVRFASLYALLNAPLLVGWIPYGGRLSEAAVHAVDGIVIWFGESLLRFDEVVLRETGSGDGAFWWSLLALTLLLAAVGALIWTAATSRHDERNMLAWLYTVLRYGLGFVMLQYGLAKVLPSQFFVPQGDMLLLPFGEVSPMGLLWRYMGFSQAFNVLAGGVEVVGGLLLLSRRTWLAGALVTSVAMAQVVALNFLFDVPVKIFSSQLLAAALVLIVPFRKRLAAALFSERALPAASPRQVTLPTQFKRFKTPLKAIALAVILAFMVDGAWHSYSQVGRLNFELAGIYDVTETTEVDGSPTTVVSISHFQQMSLWHEVGDRSTAQNFSVELEDEVLILSDYGGSSRGRLRVTRSGQEVVLAGRIGSNDVTLTLRERKVELLSRGFHWVSESPYNR